MAIIPLVVVALLEVVLLAMAVLLEVFPLAVAVAVVEEPLPLCCRSLRRLSSFICGITPPRMWDDI
jgi:hypothetical protein